MSDLRAELNAVLQAVEPGLPPTEAVMRRGRRIRSRRRLTVLAGTLAVALAAAVGYPALTRVTAAPALGRPAAHQPAALIASGTVGSQSWHVYIHVSVPGRPCFSADVGDSSLGAVCDESAPPAGTPVAWQLLSDYSYLALISGVAPDVTYVALNLAGGQQLKLIPVTRDGDRFVGLVAPQGLNITSGTVYLSDGQTMPIAQFSPPGWTRPGTNSPPSAAASLGPVFVGGQQWMVSAQEGPWGTCISTGTGGSCTTAAPMTTLTAIGMASAWDGSTIVYGSAQPTAASLTVTLTDGHSLQVPVITVGNENLWAFDLGKGQSVKSWTAFSASGKPLGTGGLPGSTATQP